MKAAILVEQGVPLEIEDVFILDRLDYGHVIVELNYSGITEDDVFEMDGLMGEDPHLPHLMGSEAVGRVVDVGAGVSKVRQGERVVIHNYRCEGVYSEPYCYKWNSPSGRKLLRDKDVIAFAEMVVVSECFLTRIPDHDQDLNHVPLMGGAMLRGMGCVERLVQPKIGESLLVVGANLVGLSVIRCATLRNVYPIVCVDVNWRRLRIATMLGAHYTERSEDKIARGGYDYVVVAEYHHDLVEFGFNVALRPGGVLYHVGGPGYLGDAASFDIAKLYGGAKIVGSWGGAVPKFDIPRMFDVRDKLMLDEMVTDVVSLENVNDGLDTVRTGKTGGRVMVEFVEKKQEVDGE